ncbi:MAG: hypothetical protein QM802_12980 [Agriterribacter sp.]
MNNISVLTDFEAFTNASNFRKIDTPAGLENYTFYISGNFVFISNSNKRAIRFSLANFNANEISEAEIHEWVNRIHKLYPTF